MDPLELSVSRFCNLVYFWATRNARSDEEVQRFDRWLVAPAAGANPRQQLERATGAWSREAELAQFKHASR